MHTAVVARTVVLPALLLASWPANAFAADYYVGGPGASDSNPGDEGQPWASLTHAVGRVEPGDVVNIVGTHNLSGEGAYIGANGTEKAPIVFRSAPGQRAKLTGNGLGELKSPLLVAGEFIEIRDLEIADSDGFGVLVWRASNVKIVGNTIHDSFLQGVFVFTEEGQNWPSDVLIEGNEIYHNARQNIDRNRNGGWPGAISTQRANRVRVIGNTIYENWGEGIVFNLTTGSVASDNVVYDNFSTNLYMDHAQDSVFERNFIYTTGNQQYLRQLDGQWSPASGVQMANEDYGGSSNFLDGNRVINNIFVGGGWGFFYGGYGLGGGMKNTLVANNTFVDATRVLLRIDGGPHDGTVFANNVFLQSAGGMVEVPPGTPISFKNNLWSGGGAGSASGAGDVFADPQLSDPRGRKPEDFRISAGSPARGKGASLPDVPEDFWRGVRGDPPDIGAHQHGSMPAPGTGGSAGTGNGEPSTPTGGTTGNPGGTGSPGQAGNPGGGGPAGTGGSDGIPVDDDDASGTNGEPRDRETAASGDGCACQLGSTGRPGALLWISILLGLGWAGLSRIRSGREPARLSRAKTELEEEHHEQV